MKKKIMNLKSLGKTELKVSPLGLGTVKLGRNTGVKYPTSFLLPDDQQLATLLLTAKDLGINLLDTAPAYGNSQERLGKFFQKNSRSDWVISSKAGEEYINNKSSYNYTPKYITSSIKQSLKLLNTDYIDVLLIHSAGNDVEIIHSYEVFNTLADLKQQGLIRAYGMSSKTLDGGLLTVQYADVVMCTLNLNYKDELPVIEAAEKLNKGVLIKKALSSGHVSNKDAIKQTFDYIFSKPGISSIVVGSINPKNLNYNSTCL
jgi:aryl-alcohol dehydrogenase-like predicted oxidoreductase